MKNPRLVILQCPHGIVTIGVDRAGSTENITGGSHCGRWSEVQGWTMSPDEWERLEAEAGMCAKEYVMEEDR